METTDDSPWHWQISYFTSPAGIIREEDLDRIDKIRNEDWVRGEEIDYNEKLVFSDDENDAKETPTPAKGNNNKRREQDSNEARKSEERSGE